jgi:UDP-N-acetylmuramyl pentapeptide phosphotransferase/UDP-N-acetylglucosamine-1-phosphate transferase
MSLSSMAWVVFAVFCIATAAVAILLRSGLAARLALDVPNARSLHAAPIPRVGGLVVVAAALGGWTMLSLPVADFAVPALLLCGFSYLDDRKGLPVLARLGAHMLAAALFLLAARPAGAPALLALFVLGLVWLINLYNFMDGMDGLAAGMALIGFGMLGAGAMHGDGTVAAACFCIAAAAAGFLAFNWHPAKIFLGDAGSIPLGFLAGAMGLQGWRDGLWPLWFPLLVFSPFIVDATATLLRRLLRGERIWQAHREHYYQRLVRMGWSHRRTASAEYAVMLATGALALLLRDAAPGSQLGGLAAAAALFLILMTAIDARWRSFDAKDATA